jgi:hypothetical protein
MVFMKHLRLRVAEFSVDARAGQGLRAALLRAIVALNDFGDGVASYGTRIVFHIREDVVPFLFQQRRFADRPVDLAPPVVARTRSSG